VDRLIAEPPRRARPRTGSSHRQPRGLRCSEPRVPISGTWTPPCTDLNSIRLLSAGSKRHEVMWLQALHHPNRVEDHGGSSRLQRYASVCVRAICKFPSRAEWGVLEGNLVTGVCAHARLRARTSDKGRSSATLHWPSLIAQEWAAPALDPLARGRSGDRRAKFDGLVRARPAHSDANCC
jgi:hypothetical protein